jgi:hypothetical protein
MKKDLVPFKVVATVVLITLLFFLLFSFNTIKENNNSRVLNTLYDVREWLQYDTDNNYIPKNKGDNYIEVINEVIYLIEQQDFIEYNKLPNLTVPENTYYIKIINSDSVSIYSISDLSNEKIKKDSLISFFQKGI